jgi:hypothetical protein
MRPLEARRFDAMMAALEEEFETPPPGEEWTEHNMTRRAWRKVPRNGHYFCTLCRLPLVNNHGVFTCVCVSEV